MEAVCRGVPAPFCSAASVTSLTQASHPFGGGNAGVFAKAEERLEEKNYVINPISGHYQSDHDLLTAIANFEAYLEECRRVPTGGKLPRINQQQALGIFQHVMAATPIRDVVDQTRQMFLNRYPSWVIVAERAAARLEQAKRKALA